MKIEFIAPTIERMGKTRVNSRLLLDTRNTVILGVKGIALTFILFSCFSIDFLDHKLIESVMASLGAFLIISVLYTVVLSYLILRSRWTGSRLILTVYFAAYSLATFLVGLDMLIFLENTSEILPKYLANGAITWAIFSLVAVQLLRASPGAKDSQKLNRRLSLSWAQGAWKLPVLLISYIILYISAGLFLFKPIVNYLDPTALEFYTNLQIPDWIFLFLILRAAILITLALPVLQMMRGHWWEAGLGIALLFSVLPSANLIGATTMPGAIRIAHFLEILVSRFLFGWIVVWLLCPRVDSNAETV